MNGARVMNKISITIFLAALFIACGAKRNGHSDTSTPKTLPPGEAPEGMVWIPGGQITLGTDHPQSYEHERHAHTVRVDGYWMAATEATNSQLSAGADDT